VSGEKFETYQAGGARFFSAERNHRPVNARRREIGCRAFFRLAISTAFSPQSSISNPVDSTGAIVESGDPSLDGPVQGAVEMVEKLAGVKEPSESLSDMSSASGLVEMKRLMTLQFRGKRAGGIKKVVAASRLRCFPLFRLMRFCTERHNTR